MSAGRSRKCRSCGEKLTADDLTCPACGVKAPREERTSNPFELSGETRPLPDPAPAPEPLPVTEPVTEAEAEPDVAPGGSFAPPDEPEPAEIDPEPQPGEVGYSPHRGDTVRISMSDVVAAWNEDAPEPGEAPPSEARQHLPPMKAPNLKLRVVLVVIAVAALVALGIVLMR